MTAGQDDDTERESSLPSIHPLKLTVDIGCEPVSLYLFWHHDLAPGLATHFVPPIATSIILRRCADFEAIADGRESGLHTQLGS